MEVALYDSRCIGFGMVFLLFSSYQYEIEIQSWRQSLQS